MVMDLLGPNLQDLMVLCGGKFSLKTSLLLTIQIVNIEISRFKGFKYYMSLDLSIVILSLKIFLWE